MKSATSAKSSPAKNAYLVFGDDDYLVERRVETIVGEIRDRVGPDVAIDRIDCEEAGLEGVVGELASPSLFSLNKIIVLRHLRLTAENKLAREIEASLASGLAPGQFLVIEATKVDKRLKLIKMIDARGGLFEETRLGAAEIRAWVGERFSELGKSAEPGVADLLIDLKGDDLRVLASEIEKTATFVGSEKKVAEKDVQALVGRSRTERIFEVVKYVMEGSTSQALGTIGDLLDAGESGIWMVGYMGREVRWFIQIALFLRARSGVWSRGMSYREFTQTTLPYFKAWVEKSGIAASQTFLYQNPYAAYLKFKEAHRLDVAKLVEMLERLVQANKFMVSMSVEEKEKLALEAFVAALGAQGARTHEE